MINFEAGPASLPQQVKAQYAKAVETIEDTSWSILELPHRSKEFLSIINESKNMLKDLLQIPDTHEVIWMQGGGRHQFGLIPMNFLPPEQTAAYIDSGHWAREAINYALFYGKVNILASTEDKNYNHFPSIPQIEENSDFNYLHITTNNTIYGTQLQNLPDTKVPIIADMSSDILSRKIDVSKYAMIYAAAQKNIGPAGCTLVIINKEFAANAKRPLPGIYSYESFIKSNSVYNTAPVSAIYASYLNIKHWHGIGMDAIEKANNTKADLLYKFLKKSKYFNLIPKADFSKMNVCFRLRNESYTRTLGDFAKEHGIIGICGHRSLGGFRISLYNNISVENVQYLVSVLEKFVDQYGEKMDKDL